MGDVTFFLLGGCLVSIGLYPAVSDGGSSAVALSSSSLGLFPCIIGILDGVVDPVLWIDFLIPGAWRTGP